MLGKLTSPLSSRHKHKLSVRLLSARETTRLISYGATKTACALTLLIHGGDDRGVAHSCCSHSEQGCRMGLLFAVYHHLNPMTGCKGLLGKVILDSSQKSPFKMLITGSEDAQHPKGKFRSF